MKKTGRYALYLLLTFLFLGGLAYVCFVVIPAHMVDSQIDKAERVAHSIRKVMTDIYNVTASESRDRTISFRITETNSIYELSTVSRKFTHSYEYSTKWLGSTKTIKLVGDYEIKAGIDLSQPLEITVSPEGKVVSLYLPEAMVTSFTPLEEQAIQEESGFWNRISSEDKEIALRSLREDARRVALEGDILQQAEQRCFEQIKARIEASVMDPGVIVKPAGRD